MEPEWLIPARAGKTAPRSQRSRPAPAHPRAGGENLETASLEASCAGSSPRGRGKQTMRLRRTKTPGLIPARAGKTARAVTVAPDERAHPRAGGENLSPAEAPAISKGSSPRGRGKPLGGGVRARSHRLIPARAGKTPQSSRAAPLFAAHPRAGGENPGWDAPLGDYRGSSPRGRGKLPDFNCVDGIFGLIPARAGKTAVSSTSTRGVPAHPRAGGENGYLPLSGHQEHGSSPRGRGKLGRWWRRLPRRGLIPARAGKTPTPKA